MALSALLDLLNDKLSAAGKHKYWLAWLLLPLMIVILINGYSLIPEEHYQRLSENPFMPRTEIHPNNYFQETLTLPLLAHWLGLTSQITFNLLCFLFILGSFVLFPLFVSRKWNNAFALVTSFLMITGPMTTIFFTWIGSPDGLTILLTIPFLFIQSNWSLFFLALLGAANHPAFIIAILEILILRFLARDRINFTNILTATAGVAAGYLIVRWFLTYYGIDTISRYDLILSKTVHEWMRLNFMLLPASLFSLFNIQWLVLVVCAVMFYRFDKRFFLGAAFFLIVNYSITFFTLDTTRVFSLLSLGVFYQCIFHSYTVAKRENMADKFETEFLESLLVIGIISLITPRYFVWVGEIHTPPFYDFLRKVLR